MEKTNPFQAEKINFFQVYAKLTKGLSPKVRDIFDRRFGVRPPKKIKGGKGQTVQVETLDSIGKGLGITRERVRQIEEAGFNSIRKNHGETLSAIFEKIDNYFNSKGGFKAESVALFELGGKNNKSYVLFLLTLAGEDRFHRACEKKDNHTFWATAQNPAVKVKETLNSLISDMKEGGKPLTKEELLADLASRKNMNNEAVLSYLEVSKKIQSNKEGKFGLIDWPEIKPRGVKDKAFLAFKQEQKPLHFRTLAGIIDKMEGNSAGKKSHPQTVHNELIKDPRFVLVGRGTYALKDWGYTPGTIKEVIAKILKDKNQPADSEEIVKEVLAQRVVAKNTVLINLNNKKLFQKTPEGKYLLREVQTA